MYNQNATDQLEKLEEAFDRVKKAIVDEFAFEIEGTNGPCKWSGNGEQQ